GAGYGDIYDASKANASYDPVRGGYSDSPTMRQVHQQQGQGQGQGQVQGQRTQQRQGLPPKGLPQTQPQAPGMHTHTGHRQQQSGMGPSSGHGQGQGPGPGPGHKQFHIGVPGGIRGGSTSSSGSSGSGSLGLHTGSSRQALNGRRSGNTTPKAYASPAGPIPHV
ncbi:unnamed protein product, partial [Discosporangium mesarthrocarpum]